MNKMGKVLSIFSFLLLLTNCIKEPKTEISYGPPIQRKKIALELQKAIGVDDSPGAFRKEDAVLKENTRQIRGRAAIDDICCNYGCNDLFGDVTVERFLATLYA